MMREQAIRANRPRGVYFPTSEAPLHLAQGWRLLDDCPPAPGAPHRDEVLLLPPRSEKAA
jgi:hypothetical protein